MDPRTLQPGAALAASLFGDWFPDGDDSQDPDYDPGESDELDEEDVEVTDTECRELRREINKLYDHCARSEDYDPCSKCAKLCRNLYAVDGKFTFCFFCAATGHMKCACENYATVLHDHARGLSEPAGPCCVEHLCVKCGCWDEAPEFFNDNGLCARCTPA